MDALKEAKLHYIQNYNWRYYDSSNMVLANMVAYTGVHVLSTTNIFLEVNFFEFTFLIFIKVFPVFIAMSEENLYKVSFFHKMKYRITLQIETLLSEFLEFLLQFCTNSLGDQLIMIEDVHLR